MALPLAAPLLVAGGKAAFGAIQGLTAKRPEAPRYEIPGEAKQALALQAGLASQQDYYQSQKEELEAQTSQAVGAIKEAGTGADMLGAITETYRNQALTKRQYDQASLDRKMMEQKSLQDALGAMASYREKAWEMNKNIPYKRAMNEFTAKKQAAGWNVFTGLSDMAGYAFNVWGGQGMDSGGGGAADTPTQDQALAGLGGATGGAAGTPGVPGMDLGAGIDMGTGAGAGFGASPYKGYTQNQIQGVGGMGIGSGYPNEGAAFNVLPGEGFGGSPYKGYR